MKKKKKASVRKNPAADGEEKEKKATGRSPGKGKTAKGAKDKDKKEEEREVRNKRDHRTKGATGFCSESLCPYVHLRTAVCSCGGILAHASLCGGRV